MREAHVTLDDSAFDAMGIEELVSLCREAGLQEVTELVCRGTGSVVQVTVDSPIDEERLSSLDCVDEYEHLADSTDAHHYTVAFTAPELPEDLAEQVDELVGTCDPVVNERGVDVSFVGPQEAISSIVEEYGDAGLSPNLERIGAFEGHERPLDELTDRQRETIQTAYDMGYYEVPRQVTTEDIAPELGVEPSTVAEHLQRAERNLLSRHL